jgi:hypothetical protein
METIFEQPAMRGGVGVEFSWSLAPNESPADNFCIPPLVTEVAMSPSVLRVKSSLVNLFIYTLNDINNLRALHRPRPMELHKKLQNIGQFPLDICL